MRQPPAIRRRWTGALLALALAPLAPAATEQAPVAPGAAGSGLAQAPLTASRQNDEPLPGVLSARNANYDIDARLDPATRTLTGTALIRWRNIGQGPADFLRLHLYWNAWRDSESTWLRQRRLAGDGGAEPAPGDWAYINVTSLDLVTEGGSATNLLPRVAFVQPDDGNAADTTLASIAMPAPVQPGR